jgi:hypothetical protein
MSRGEQLSLNREDFTASSSMFALTDVNDIFDFFSSAFRTSDEEANISFPLINKSMYGAVDKIYFVSLYWLPPYFLLYIYNLFCYL